jgi:hypothetical protein
MNIILRFSGILLLTVLSIGVAGIVVIKADLLSRDLWITSASGVIVPSVGAPSLPMSDTEFKKVRPIFFERCTGCHGVQHYLRK